MQAWGSPWARKMGVSSDISVVNSAVGRFCLASTLYECVLLKVMYHRYVGLISASTPFLLLYYEMAQRDEALLINGYSAVNEAFSLDPRRTVGDLFGCFHGKLCGTTVYLIILPLSKLLLVTLCAYPRNGLIR